MRTMFCGKYRVIDCDRPSRTMFDTYDEAERYAIRLNDWEIWNNREECVSYGRLDAIEIVPNFGRGV